MEIHVVEVWWDFISFEFLHKNYYLIIMKLFNRYVIDFLLDRDIIYIETDINL